MPENILKRLFADPEIPDEQARETINSQDHFDIARLLHLFTVEEKVKVFQYLTGENRRRSGAGGLGTRGLGRRCTPRPRGTTTQTLP